MSNFPTLTNIFSILLSIYSSLKWWQFPYWYVSKVTISKNVRSFQNLESISNYSWLSNVTKQEKSLFVKQHLPKLWLKLWTIWLFYSLRWCSDLVMWIPFSLQHCGIKNQIPRLRKKVYYRVNVLEKL